MIEARRGSLVVRGERTDGSIGEIDALDLDEASFRRFVLCKLAELGALEREMVDLGRSETVLYAQALPPGHPRERRS